MENIERKRLAVLVGCNYPHTRNELHGCINDVLTMRDTLVSRFGFDPCDIQLLTDAAAAAAADAGFGGSSSVLPTGANIKKALGEMVDQAKPGDVLYFHYSGHGTRIPSLKPGNPFRQDEAIVPCDFNLITDVDFRQLVNRLPTGASFTILSDSCHSGGLIDKEKEQIGPSHVTETSSKSSSMFSKPRAIAFETILHHLSSLTGINTSDIATHLLELFAADASLKFRLPPLEVLDMFESSKPDEGILLSGCQANETSADVTNAVMTGGKPCGAFSNAVQMVLKDDHEVELSNKKLVLLARQVLKEQGFEQHPCLYCTDENADATFLSQSQE